MGIDRLIFGLMYRVGFTQWDSHKLSVRLAELVQRCFPSLERLRFVSSGTEACMSAIRLARGYTGRNFVIKFEGCYHGHADALLVKAGSGVATFGIPGSAGVPEETAAGELGYVYLMKAGRFYDRRFRCIGRFQKMAPVIRARFPARADPRVTQYGDALQVLQPQIRDDLGATRR